MQAASDLVGHKELADLFIQDLAGEDQSPAERVRIMARHYMVMRNYENIHYQYLTGMLTEDEWQGLRLNIKANFEWESLRDYWQNERQFYSEAFQAEIDRIQSEVGAGSSTYDYINKSSADA